MARTITSTAAGRVNRKFLFLALILASLSAVLVYAAVSQSDGGGSAGGEDVSVLVAKGPIEAGTTLTADLLTTRDLPSGAVGLGSLRSNDLAVGRQTIQFIEEGEPVLSSKLVGSDVRAAGDSVSYVVPEGMRAMSINVNQVIGVGGLVLPGDHVDIFWIPDKPLTDSEGAMLLAENIEVLAVEQTLADIAPTVSAGEDEGGEAAQDRVRGSEEDLIPNAATMTLVLTPEQSARIFCAESGGSIRLAVRQFGDESSTGLAPATCVVLADEDATQP